MKRVYELGEAKIISCEFHLTNQQQIIYELNRTNNLLNLIPKGLASINVSTIFVVEINRICKFINIVNIITSLHHGSKHKRYFGAISK